MAFLAFVFVLRQALEDTSSQKQRQVLKGKGRRWPRRSDSAVWRLFPDSAARCRDADYCVAWWASFGSGKPRSGFEIRTGRPALHQRFECFNKNKSDHMIEPIPYAQTVAISRRPPKEVVQQSPPA
ncbi:uncharacterized protein LAESUDRAFT_718118 [Laetiporus sulphureus 93-53]|uniref:Secreted protein n=1 Tax=Laetiporus sulphureus 93-53 TaxID=1314785 RepID=A0A165B8Y7_9APHY|nr:uncharacterized protein LAESUDRAFT_718118 [Laetiporus sulphureus 93-53]KZT00517.1 hypothetical protein LAESUDRAFT_718118 [Laetiporus sulphureus 93-53]